MDILDWLIGLTASIDTHAREALIAVTLLLGGCAFGAVGRMVAGRLMAAAESGVDRRFPQKGPAAKPGLMRAAHKVVGNLVFWSVFLAFAAAAMERLPLPVMAEAVRNIADFFPRILIAAVIAFVGARAGGLARELVARVAGRAGMAHAQVLGRAAQIAVMVVSLTVCVQQVGLDSRVFSSLLLAAVVSVLGGMALAFGLGSGPLITNILASHYAAKAYRIGERVSIAGVEGVLREVNPTAIVLDVGGDRVFVPARKHCDELSVLVGKNQ